MFAPKQHAIDKEDAEIILAVFSDAQSIRCTGEHEYQITFAIAGEPSTVSTVIEDRQVKKIKLITQ